MLCVSSFITVAAAAKIAEVTFQFRFHFYFLLFLKNSKKQTEIKGWAACRVGILEFILGPRYDCWTHLEM